MFHACTIRFDVTGNFENFFVFELNKAEIFWKNVQGLDA